MVEYTTQVAVAGGGPVGIATALELARRGIDVVVIERREQLQRVPKGQNLTQRTMEHFRNWGIERELRAARTTDPTQPATGLTAYGTLQGDYHYPWLQRERVGAFYAADNERLPQYQTETVLRARLAEYPNATLLAPWKVESVEQDDGGATVGMTSPAGEQGAVRADYVVGCDGSRSRVRRSVGIGEALQDHHQHMLLVVFRSAQFDEVMERFPGVAFVNVLNRELGGYWQFFGRVDSRGTWFFHAPVDPAATIDTIDVPAVLARAIGTDVEIEVEYRGFWDLRFALADSYRRGSVFIAGDAAHSHPPYGGYGINSGFEDAANLGWKLAAVLDGWGGAALLDSYDAERRPVFASTRDDFIARSISRDRDFLDAHDPLADRAAFEGAWFEREEGARDEVGAFEPNYAGSPIVPDTRGRPTALGAHETRARAGHHLAPGVTSDGRELFAELGPGFTLLTEDARAADGVAASARVRGIPLRVIELDGASVEAFRSPQVLVRPDQFVAWAGNLTYANAEDILDVPVGTAP